MKEYSISSDASRAVKSALPFLFVIPFLFYIIPTSAWLIHESAMFIASAIDYSYPRALLAAALIELGIIFLTILPVGHDERFKGIVRLVLLCAALIVIIGSASKYAIQPYEADDNISAANKMKLSAMTSNIESLEKALASVNGQAMNSAIASRALQAAIAERQAFVSSLSADPNLAQSNVQKKYLAVMLRIALQFINLYILSSLKKSIVNRVSKNSVKPQSFDNIEDIRTVQPPHPKDIHRMKASDLVRHFYPDAKYEKVDDRHFILSGNGRNTPLAETRSPGSAWLSAAKTIRQEQGI